MQCFIWAEGPNKRSDPTLPLPRRRAGVFLGDKLRSRGGGGNFGGLKVFGRGSGEISLEVEKVAFLFDFHRDF